jgi:hypothetical protein
MNKLIICFLILSGTGSLISQIEEVNYYPLKEGNVWVYQVNTSMGQSFKMRKKVLGSMITNGHKYYNVENVHYRVDSSTANVFQLTQGSGCSWSVNEKLQDSLRAILNDSALKDCGTIIIKCIDTDIRVKFGISMNTKHFRYWNSGNAGGVYAKNFGLISAYGGSGINLYGQELLGCVLDGVVYGDTSMLTVINLLSSEIPLEFSLSQNYPNPFNPVTKIKFQVPKSPLSFGEGQGVGLKIYNALGHEVQILVNESLQPGTYEVDWDASNFPSGVYFYELTSGDFTQTKKMVLLK